MICREEAPSWLRRTIENLEQELQQLRVEVGLLRSGSHGSGIDLVRLDDIVVYAPTNDNLYTNFIPDQCKNYNLAERGIPDLNRDAIEWDVTKILYRYIEIAAAEAGAVNLFDIGAWIGDISIKLARFARLAGIAFKASCYDPSFAGSLVPFNAALNHVGNDVTFFSLGISLTGGSQVFSQVRGHSDSSRLASIGMTGQTTDTYIINTLTLPEILARSDAEGHRIIKLDVEGIDALIVDQYQDIVSKCTVIIEFNPRQDQYQKIGAEKFLRTICETHDIYDLYYAPRPTRVDRISDISAFIGDVSRRHFGYTDILMVPRVHSFHETFRDIASSYFHKPPAITMADPDEGGPAKPTPPNVAIASRREEAAMTGEDRNFVAQQMLDIGRQLYAAIDQKIGSVQMRHDVQLQDVRRITIKDFAPANTIALGTDHPVAQWSNDHTAPQSTKDDNTRNPRFCQAAETYFGRKVAALDLGCAGGGLVFDFLIRGNVAFGLEGSDYSAKAQRAEWATIPDYLETCDLTKSFRLTDVRTNAPVRFDVITMWQVLERIPEVLLPQLFANVKSHLAEDGLFVGSVATQDDVTDGISYNPTVKREMWWRETAQRHGLQFVPKTMFAFKDYCRGSGNQNTFYDADFSKNPELGFHFVMKHLPG